MKERILSLSLVRAIEAFQAIRWKFFEADDERNLVKVEVPRGIGESFVVELRYEGDKERECIIDKLLGADFIQQMMRITSNF